MKKLDILTVTGFKSIRSLADFELRDLNVLIGGNGAGKSNVVDFFRMLNAMMKTGGLAEFVEGNADAFLYGGPSHTEKIGVKLRLGQNGYDFALKPMENGGFLIIDESRHYYKDRDVPTTRNFNGPVLDSSLIGDKEGEAYGEPGHNASWYTYEAINSWQVYHFHDTSSTSGMRRLQDQGHCQRLAGDASNIAAFLRGLRVSNFSAYRDILDAVSLVIPFLDDFVLEPNDNEMLRLSWRQKGLNDFPMRPSQLSDGSIRFICLATALLQPTPPSTIIIDEPELGLHPQAISVLSELIKGAAQRTQVIISTQSPALIDNFGIEDIIVVNREEGATTLKRLDEADFSAWLETYSVGELWRKNVIVGGPSHE